jgi:hypothetical protein
MAKPTAGSHPEPRLCLRAGRGQSVTFGLALIGLEDNLEPWLARSVTGREHGDLGDDPD